MTEQTTTARAPGKLILCGEHAVVHGCTAVAMAVNRYAECSVATIPARRLHIEAPDFCTEVNVPLDEALTCTEAVRGRYQAFLDGRCGIREVLLHSGELLLFAVMRAAEGVAFSGGLHIRLSTELPVGCGMGSSAAVASAVIQAVGRHVGRMFEKNELFERVMDCERLQHGHPSGVDAHASIYGGCMTYRRGGAIQPLALKNFELTLLHTGAPEASTGECVAQVKEHFTDSTLRPDFERVAQSMTAALRYGDSAALIPPVRENHRLLTQIGVVPERVQRLVAAVEARGGAAKICGAGSIRGEAAGMVWLISGEPAATWCAQFGCSSLTVRMA